MESRKFRRGTLKAGQGRHTQVPLRVSGRHVIQMIIVMAETSSPNKLTILYCYNQIIIASILTFSI